MGCGIKNKTACMPLSQLERLHAFKVARAMVDGVDERNFFCQQLQGVVVIVGLLGLAQWVKGVVDDRHAEAGHVHTKLVFFARYGLQLIQTQCAV